MELDLGLFLKSQFAIAAHLQYLLSDSNAIFKVSNLGFFFGAKKFKSIKFFRDLKNLFASTFQVHTLKVSQEFHNLKYVHIVIEISICGFEKKL